MRALVAACALGVLVALAPGAALAAPGELDGSYATGGVFTAAFQTSHPSEQFAAVDSQGRTVIAATHVDSQGQSHLDVMRLTPQGALDTTFNPGGSTPGVAEVDFSASVGSADVLARGVAVTAGDKVVALGWVHDTSHANLFTALVQLDNDGGYDTSFGPGRDGRAVDLRNPNYTSSPDSLAVYSSGRILVGGSCGNGCGGFVARYTDAGAPDTGFDANFSEPGVLAIARASNVSSLAPLNDGSVLAAGGVSGNDNAVIARVQPDGTLDPTFNSGGATPGVLESGMGRQPGPTSLASASGVAPGPGGSVYATGQVVDSNGSSMRLLRLTSAGDPDPGFGDGSPATGVVTVPVVAARGQSVVVDGSSCPVAVGSATVPGQDGGNRILAARLSPGGQLDQAFNPNGSTPGTALVAAGDSASGETIALQDDGNIVIAGYAQTITAQNTDRRAIALRLQGGGCGTGAPTTLMTSQSWEAPPEPPRQGSSITVPFDATGERDQATITGNNTFMAAGTVTFGLYSSSQCTQGSQVFTSANRVPRSFTPFAVVDSDPVNSRLAPGTYYWTAAYSGDSRNQPSTSPCGAETLTVASRTPGPAATTLTTSQTWRSSPGPSPQGASITVPFDATGESDRATITGNTTFMAAGTVTFGLYSSPQCTPNTRVFSSTNRLAGGPTPFAVADSDPVSTRLAPGTYYWSAAYSGDSRNQPSTSPCGAETLTVSARVGGGGGGVPIASFAPPRIVRPGAVTTLNASASQNAAQYEWDLNGDGRPDVSCRTSQLQTQLLPVTAVRPSGDRAAGHAAVVARVGLTVVSATGQASSVTQNVSLANAGINLAPAAASFYRNTQNALCLGAGLTPQAICIAPTTEVWGVIEAQGCDLHRVTGTQDLPAQEDRALIQTAIDRYNSSGAFVSYENALCEASLLPGAANCRFSRRFDRHDLMDALNSGSIELFECRGPVSINGLQFFPGESHPLVISPQLQAIFWSHTEIDLNDKALPLPSSGEFDFRDVNAPLSFLPGIYDRQSPPFAVDMNVPRGALPGLGGLIPQTATLSFARSGISSRYTKIDASVALPGILKALDGGKSTFRWTFTLSNETDLQIGHIHATAPNIDFGPIGVDEVAVDYDNADPKPLLVTGKIKFLDADVSFAPQLPNHPQNGILFYGSQFQRAHATLDFACPSLCPPELFPGVTLNSIDAGISRGPWVLSGGGELRIVDLVTFNAEAALAFASDDQPWTLDRTWLPQLPDDFAPQTFTTLTAAAAGSATVNLPILNDAPLAHGYLIFAAPGYVSFGGSVSWSLAGIVSFDGGLSGQVNAVNKRFNFAGHLQSCVVHVLCAGAFGVVSDAGAGACFSIGPVNVGGGVQFPSHVYIWPFDGCKWSRFTEDHVFDGARDTRARGPLAAMRSYVVHIAPGDPSRAISIDGDRVAPAVHVTGPGGQDVSSSTGDCTPATETTYNGSTCLTIVGHIRIIRSPTAHETVVGLQNPAPGTYTITPDTAASGFAKVFTANDPASPRITGSVVGTGTSRTLRYSVRPIPDEKVTFLDVGPQGAREIGSVNGGRTGALTFTPAPGNATHSIEAEVEMAGLPVPILAGGSSGALDTRGARAAGAGGPMVTIARFRPPRPVHAGRVRSLRVQRRGTVVRVSWRKARGAIRYVLVLRLRAGTMRTVIVRGTSARITGVARTEPGQITVRAIGTDGRPGAAIRGQFRATAKPHTILRRLA